MNEVTIRNATRSDSKEIGGVLLDFYNMYDTEEAIHAFETELEKDYHYIVALENEKIIGLITWLIHGLPKHGLFELDRICLLSESRAKGVGKKLVDALINDARSWYEDQGSRIRKLYLLTHEDNISAHIFYEKVGFTHETTLTGHYYDDKDERLYSIFF